MASGLTYEEFVQKITEMIIKAAHLPEDYVFFKKKKDRNNRKMYRLFVVRLNGFREKTSAGFLWKNFTRIIEGTSWKIEARVKCDLIGAGNMENTR